MDEFYVLVLFFLFLIFGLVLRWVCLPGQLIWFGVGMLASALKETEKTSRQREPRSTSND